MTAGGGGVVGGGGFHDTSPVAVFLHQRKRAIVDDTAVETS